MSWDFVFGLMVGLVVGAGWGVLLMAAMVAGSNADDRSGNP